MDVQAKPCYKRILLKLSGAALMGEDSFGINRAVLQHMIEELRTALDLGVQVGIVVGGGNIFRASHSALPVWTAPPATTWACSQQ